MKIDAWSVATVWLIASSLAAPMTAATIGLVPDPDPVRHLQLVHGAQLALGGEPRLVIGREAGHWNGMTAVIEELVTIHGADVLIAPVDRRGAHLVAQIATRRHLPAVAPSSRGGLAATGSWWFVTCEWDDRDSDRLAEQLGRPPSEWELAGWSAARIAKLLLEEPTLSWSSPGSTWRDRLPAACITSDLSAHPNLSNRESRDVDHDG